MGQVHFFLPLSHFPIFVSTYVAAVGFEPQTFWLPGRHFTTRPHCPYWLWILLHYSNMQGDPGRSVENQWTTRGTLPYCTGTMSQKYWFSSHWCSPNNTSLSSIKPVNHWSCVAWTVWIQCITDIVLLSGSSKPVWIQCILLCSVKSQWWYSVTELGSSHCLLVSIS